MIRAGLIGYGYWGPNLARNLIQSPDFELVRIADLDERRLKAAASVCQGVELTRETTAVTQAADLDFVVVATPAWTHFPLTSEALQAGKHVLVEKPMATSVDDCRKLQDMARAKDRLLLVDHTFIYTPAVKWIADFVAAGSLGEPYYFDSIRANLGLFQRDVSVLWDLAPHDLSVLAEFIPREPQSLIAVGSCHAGSRVEDIIHLTLDLGDGCLAHFHVSWLSPVKVRRMLLAGSSKMVVFDDLEATEKVKVYDSGVRIEHNDVAGQHRMQVEYRTGDMMSPALTQGEALRTEMQHVAQCIRGEANPRSGGESGLRVVQLLEAAQHSIENDGKRVKL